MISPEDAARRHGQGRHARAAATPTRMSAAPTAGRRMMPPFAGARWTFRRLLTGHAYFSTPCACTSSLDEYTPRLAPFIGTIAAGDVHYFRYQVVSLQPAIRQAAAFCRRYADSARCRSITWSRAPCALPHYMPCHFTHILAAIRIYAIYASLR